MNTHTDTRLTDYALGELDDAARREVEQLMEADGEARRAVDDVAGLATMLRAATMTEADGAAAKDDSLRSALAERVRAASAHEAGGTPVKTHRIKPATIWAVAASIAVMVTSVGAVTMFGKLAERSNSPMLARLNDADEDYDLPDQQNMPLSGKPVAQGRPATRDYSVPTKKPRPESVVVTDGTTSHYSYTGGLILDGGTRQVGPSGQTPGPIVSNPVPTKNALTLPAAEQTPTRQFMIGVGVDSNSGVVGGITLSPPLDGVPDPAALPVPMWKTEPEFVPYGSDLKMFDRPGLGVYGQGARPTEGWFGSVEYLNWAVQAPPRTATGTTTISAGTLATSGAGGAKVAQDQTLGPSATVGMSAPGVFSTDLEIPFSKSTLGQTSNGEAAEADKKKVYPVTDLAIDVGRELEESRAKYGPAHPKTKEAELKLGLINGTVDSWAFGGEGRPQDARSVETLFPLYLEREELSAKLGDKHPKTQEVELKIRIVQSALTDHETEFHEVMQPMLVEREKLLASGLAVDHPQVKGLTGKIASIERRWDVEKRTAEQQHNTEAYDAITENAFLKTTVAPLSTFSIDVDTASYSNVRRMLNNGERIPRDAVRLEEFINYFTYEYPTPTGNDPFAVTTEAARCPWNGDHMLVRIGLKGKEIHRKERPATNLVFLVDVSGSMQDANKLPLVRESLKLMVNELADSDRVAMVVYAGSTGLVLPSTGGDRKQTIREAIDRLEAGGSTNGASGITLAYQVAAENFIKGGVNRVVLATDGDFNVGVTNQGDLVQLIEAKKKTGVFFSALGYGMGNLKDSTLEKLADKGNGNYAYIDTLAEARKVLVEQMSGTLVTIAKDVKIQIEFNPARVAAYRLLGYENRILAAQDFNDDKKDAGEIGAGHTVTALYELIPAGDKAATETKKLPTVDPLKFQQPTEKTELTDAAKEPVLLNLKLRYKQPDGDVSKLIERPLADDVRSYAQASGDFKFAASVAAFGMVLRESKYRGSATLDAVLELAQEGIGADKGGYRAEFVELVRKAKGTARGK